MHAPRPTQTRTRLRDRSRLHSQPARREADPSHLSQLGRASTTTARTTRTRPISTGVQPHVRPRRPRPNAIADADAALRDAEQRHKAALSAAASDLAKRQARFDRELSQTVADRDHVSQRLSAAEIALANVRHDHQTAAADVERLTQLEADLTSRLADVQAARDAVERQLADTASALKHSSAHDDGTLEAARSAATSNGRHTRIALVERGRSQPARATTERLERRRSVATSSRLLPTSNA